MVGGFFFFRSNSSESTSLNTPESQLTLTPTPEFKEFTASFEIYTNGTKRDFSDSKYHNRSEDAFIEPAIISLIIGLACENQH